ncbi:CASP2-like protein [Mya arenaria]|uniref:CASP2-like protein n=1 Tax=Mya arenaria TaxID=6604 RepID=A0ABY7F1G4_MYAAR|nr:CASP2-like protein [Mya arenaria]
MEECHKDILLIQRVNLVDNMNMRGGLLSQLIARKVLDPRMVREIKTGRTLDQQAEELLDILPQCGSKAFKLFCDALVADKQGELVSLFLKSETENNETSENNSDRKSSPACVQETETGETKESVSLTHSASRESLPTASYVQPVTIREEYQQESYRRSIEPHGAILVEPNLDQGHGIMQRRPSDDQDFQQEARYFYENKFLDPSKVSKSVYSVYNSGGKRFREDVDSVPNQDVPDRQVNQTAVERLVHSDLQNSKDIVRIPTPQKTKPSPIPIISESPRVTSQPKFYIQGDLEHEKGQRSSLLGAMDDPEIDLTDGPITVHVELCARQFYLNHYKKAYQMARIPRGKALILNVNQVVGKTERRGTDIDRDNLHHLLCQLHFDEMVKKLQDFSQDPGHALGDCCVVCILSHGEEGYIFGADGKKFELDAVFSLFDNTCCPDLRGKPKMFIIQACRGGALDRGVQYYPDEHDGADARVRQVPSMSDMLICYPTQEDRGSWYVEALVQVFMKYAHCEDVCAMLNRVNLLVSKKVSHCPNADMDRMSQMSEYKSTLRMPHLFFFPGIGTA